MAKSIRSLHQVLAFYKKKKKKEKRRKCHWMERQSEVEKKLEKDRVKVKRKNIGS